MQRGESLSVRQSERETETKRGFVSRCESKVPKKLFEENERVRFVKRDLFGLQGREGLVGDEGAEVTSCESQTER
jgi:hypothetical protein